MATWGTTSGSAPTPASAPVRAAVGLAGWWLQPLLLVLELAAVAAVSVPYSLVGSTISDLGARTCTTVAYPSGPVAVCSPWHAAVNAGFVVGGLLLAVGALMARRLLPRRRLSTTAVVLWVVSGLSGAATGLVPLDVDAGLHLLVSTPVFLAQPVAMVLTGVALRPRHPLVGWAGVVLGLVALLAGGTVALWLEAPALGLLERAALWPTSLYLFWVAVVLVRPARR